MIVVRTDANSRYIAYSHFASKVLQRGGTNPEPDQNRCLVRILKLWSVQYCIKRLAAHAESGLLRHHPSPHQLRPFFPFCRFLQGSGSALKTASKACSAAHHPFGCWHQMLARRISANGLGLISRGHFVEGAALSRWVLVRVHLPGFPSSLTNGK